jgi:CRISPR-associated endonuclease Cas1
MAATATVSHLLSSRNLAVPRNGVVTLFGYGITVCVDRGHLILKDGIGKNRYEARLPRVGHGLRRLVVIGSDGLISLSALRWIADQNAAFVMLERDGSVLATTGPVRPTDARLRRAQSVAGTNGLALEISKDLIRKKLTAQEQLAREKLHDSRAADLIAINRDAVDDSPSIGTLRLVESRAAHEYWSAWRNLPVIFPKHDLPRVPQHWQYFGSRVSPLTGSPRLAANPQNAILNYLYALLESESRLAASALGLDPGIGFMHVDTPARDSLACDLMEPVRPLVDAHLLEWLTREPLRRKWFYEENNGNCRLMGSFAVRLSETATTWGKAVAPIAESVARLLALGIKKQVRSGLPPTRLTQSLRRAARGISATVSLKTALKPTRLCRTCGEPLKHGFTYCGTCAVNISRMGMIETARLGRIATHTEKAEALRSATKRRHDAELKAWNPSDLPEWLNEETYRKEIQPRLAELKISVISSALGISKPYATDIQRGRVPHPRHWSVLARVAGFSKARME